jgi:Ca2+-binding RTX toxin-like protein
MQTLRRGALRGRRVEGMRRVALVLAAMALALLLASGVALALNKVGTDGPDTLRGTNQGDNLSGRGGNDKLYGLAGNDNLQGGSGKDVLLGGYESRPTGGDNNLMGGPGNDIVLGERGSNNVAGNRGNDFLVDPWEEDFAKDKISGGDGNDVIDVVNDLFPRDVVICGDGFDRVISDREDVVAPDCEKVFVGSGSYERFYASIPKSFSNGLPQF